MHKTFQCIQFKGHLRQKTATKQSYAQKLSKHTCNTMHMYLQACVLAHVHEQRLDLVQRRHRNGQQVIAQGLGVDVQAADLGIEGR